MIKLDSPVLVADPNSETRDQIIGELKKLGFKKFLLAEDRKTAATSLYQKGEGEEVSLIILGDDVFETDAQEYLEMIWSVDEFCDTPVIAYSKDIDVDLAMKYMDFGVLSFLIEPVTARKLAATLLLLKNPTQIEDENSFY